MAAKIARLKCSKNVLRFLHCTLSDPTPASTCKAAAHTKILCCLN